jgi:hypothetical protein
MESLRISSLLLENARTRSEIHIGLAIDYNEANPKYRYATDIVRECAEAWEKLITGKTNPGDVST